MIAISRRSLMTALGGLCPLLVPFVRRLDVHAASPTVKRFVLFQTANGFPREELWGHAGLPDIDEIDAVRETPMAFGEGVFSPLLEFQQRMLIARGLYNPFDLDLHGNVFASLSLRPGGEGQPGGISLDRHIAQRIGAAQAFPSIALATAWQKSDSFSRAADGPAAPFPAEVLPQEAFAKIFGSMVDASEDLQAAARARAERRTSIVDFAVEDTQRLRARISGTAAVQLDQYLESLRQVEKQVLAQAEGAARCDANQAPRAEFERSMQPTDEHIEAQLGVAFQALACGLTRVVNVAFGTSDGKISHYGFPALAHTGSHHKYEHDGNLDALSEIATYIHDKIAGFLRRLAEVPEDGASMLDHTLVLMVNDGGGQHHNGQNNIPLLQVGDAGGFFRPGRIVSYPSETRSTADAFVSVLHALGIDDATFGDASVNRGGLTELS